LSETGEKILNPSATRVQQSREKASFFGKSAGENGFFSSITNTHSFFNSSNSIQAKLNVSKPDDPQEKEADRMAERVMTMPEPTATPTEERKEEGVQRKEEEKEEQVQTKSTTIQLMEEPKEEEKAVQRAPEELEHKEHEKVQAKCEACEHEEKEEVQRVQTKANNVLTTNVNRKNISLHPSDVVQLSGRGPPASSKSFEQSLSESKGGGSPLPESTRSFMESRFSADFAGVRIHTSSQAESMNRQVNAQAFAHGSDIYFNSGKYSPHTSSGSLLLAHELTHTIQQGASKHVSSPTASSVANRKMVAPKTAVQKSIDKQQPGISNSTSGVLEAKEQEGSDVHTKEESPVSNTSIPSDINNNDNRSLSNWNVNYNGNLHLASAAPANVPTNKLQMKEEETREKEEEGKSVVQPLLQKKYDHSIQTKECIECRSHTVDNSDSPIQTQKIISDSSLNNTNEVKISDHSPQQDRGPPISTSSQLAIHRSPIDDALEFAGSLTDCLIPDFEEAKHCAILKAQQVALHVTGFRALRVVLGQDPITHERIERNGRNFIEAALDIMPGGSLLQQKLIELQLLDRAAAWIDIQIARVEALVSGLIGELTSFWNGLGLLDLRSPLDVLHRGVSIVMRFISRVIDFAESVALELLGMVKEYLLSKIVDFIKEETPAYPLLTVILGKDPITGQVVERNGTNILNALLELGGEEGRLQRTQMQETGSFKRVADYIDRGIVVFSGAYEQIVVAFHNIWDRVSIASLMDPRGTFQMIYNEFAQPVQRVWEFVREVGAVILRFIKEVLMTRLSAWARTQRGFLLITVIIGKDPFTDEVVPRSVENIIHGFMSLMDGGEEQFNQMKESGAIARAAAQIDAAVAKLNMTPAYVVQLFIDVWNSFTLNDLIHPIVAFHRIMDRFGEPIIRLLAFVVEIIRIVIHVILQIMNFPFDLINNIITKAMMAIELIKADPIGFLKNLLRAIKQGFLQFFDNILTHLWNGLKAWFLKEVKDAGIPMPTDFTVLGLVKWLLAVLDITMEKVWKKLEERIGKEKVAKIKKIIAVAEKVVGAVGEAYQFYKDVQERGFMPVMIEKLKEKMSNIWDMVLGAVQSFVMDTIIKKVVTKLLSMLDPTGIMAVINSAIALYKAIQSFIKYLREMLEIVNSFVEGTLQIAQGVVQGAADFLERALARGVPIVIGFLANQVGLNLSERLKDALEGVRAWADTALTWLIDRVVTLVEQLIAMGKAAVGKILGWLGIRKNFKDTRGEDHDIYFEGSENSAQLYVASYNPRTIPTLLTAVAKIIDKPANKSYKQNYEDAKTLNTEIEAIKTKLADPNNANAEKDNEEMNKKLDDLAMKLPPLMTMVGGTEPPPLVKPEFVNGVKASSFEVFYLKKGRTSGGSAANTNSGATLPGWAKINQSGLSAGSAWVKMHLLHDDLGGPALDTNLTPATSQVNGAFYREVESKALTAINGGQAIWYKTTISYHGGADIDYPNYVSMEFGPYEFNDTTEQWEKRDRGAVVEGDKVGEFHEESPTPPDFTGSVLPNLNDSNLGRVKIQNIDPRFTRQFAEFVVDVKNTTLLTITNMQSVLDQSHQQRIIKVEDYTSQRDTLIAAHSTKYVLK